MYKLKEAVLFFHIKNETIIQLGKKKWKVLDAQMELYDFLKHDIKVTNDEEQKYFNFLMEEKLLTEKMIYSKDRFLKNRFYFEDISKGINNRYQEDFFKKKVMIIGLGGVGSVVLFNLVAMGVKHFILIDGDNVDISNFNRQIMFDIDDIGKSKVVALKEKLHKIDNSIEVEICDRYIENSDDINKLTYFDYELLVNAADTPQNLNVLLLENIKMKKNDFITAGVGLHSGKFTSVISNYYLNDALAYFQNTIPEEKGTILKASISPTNMLISALLSNEILKYWTSDRLTIPKINYIDFDNYTIESEGILNENRS
ncbi:ThiF family adenylyltransferase [Streptococcus sp. H49]|uniref:ThiF family adenylyltransferase n=1 Tax=Streptococcus huangxiaojuni TaxID=3237239 RepID=UPI0034A12386